MADGDEKALESVRQIAASADFRNTEPEGPLGGLTRLEKRFRETVAVERRTMAQRDAAIRAIGRKGTVAAPAVAEGL
jgi:hypothetical protein